MVLLGIAVVMSFFLMGIPLLFVMGPVVLFGAVFAVVREGAQSHCIVRQVGTHPVQMLVIQVGTRQPLGVGAAGLALLAALPDAEVQAIIAENAPQLGAYGGMTPERMRLLVRTTRERGWSVIGNHATRGVLAAGMAP